MMFQHKISHYILATNSFLYKMKKIASPFCPFCPSDGQTVWHMFVHCTQANSFWSKFQEWYSVPCNTMICLTELKIMFGIISCHTSYLALNHLIILGKYFFHVNTLHTVRCHFDDNILLVRKKVNLEKYIAVMSY